MLPVFVIDEGTIIDIGGIMEEELMYVRAAFLCSLDQTLPVPHWNQGSEMKLGIRESNYMYKYIHCNCCAITEEKGIGVVSSTVARGRNLIPAHEARRLSQPT